MACNFLPNRLLEVNKNSDTLSEGSECGTTTSEWTSSWDSKEELRDLISKLGLKDISDLHQDRFRVDRKKLEQMLTGHNDALIPADVFFAKVMEDTDTYITWPNKLKIGAKSKKDPHVRIAGRPDDVKAAKERIITLLDTKCNRITMKIDVSYTDHSHIIGKGGLTIKRVMEETQCHVHFPDSNRSNTTEKSNQVSVSGDINGVESARSRVRELIPLIFGFELPIMTQSIDSSSYIEKIQEQYNVQVMFKTRPKLHATFVIVKGVEWEVDQVKQATILLMEYMCENLANQIPVQMSMEISPHNHQIVLGKNHSNLKLIMQYTNCKIMFADAQDPNIPNLKKSNVSISGNIHDVYKARQLLMGSLPLIIIFDLPEECSTSLRTRQDQIADVQANCDVTVTIRQKAKQNTRACVIKGVEKNAENVYKARSYILGFEETCIIVDIPPSYHFPQELPSPLPQTSSNINLMASTNNTYPMSPMLSPLISSSWPHPTTPTGQNGPPFVGMVQQPQFLYNMSQPALGSNGYHSINQNPFTNNSVGLEQHNEVSSYSGISSNNSPLSSTPSPRVSTSSFHRQYVEAQNQRGDLSSVLSQMISPGYHGTSVDKRQDKNNLTPVDSENKRIAGFRAMQNKNVAGTYRQPNNSWSGYYLSHTSPAPFADSSRPNKEDVWNIPTERGDNCNSSAAFNTSNIVDHTSNYLLNNLISSDCADLATMLTSLGLERYLDIFTKHEIDLAIFSTMNDRDLVEIGINTFGARRKILLAISELNKRSNSFSAAPGAERKTSPTISSSSYQPSSESSKW